MSRIRLAPFIVGTHDRRHTRLASIATICVALASAQPAAAVCGDLNDNGSVQVTDALVCLQGVTLVRDISDSCTPEPSCSGDPGAPPCGDVNGSDTANVTDCLLILQASTFVVDISAGCDCEPTNVCDGITPVSGTDITTELFVGFLNQPVHVHAAPPPFEPDRIYIVEQMGLIYTMTPIDTFPLIFADLTDRVSFLGDVEERGLLSMAFHPDFPTTPWVFVNYTDFSGATVVSRFDVTPMSQTADGNSEKILITIDQIDPYHNGGQLAFGPDGYLYIGMGDGNGNIGGDPAGTAQNDDSLLGKMLRVDVDVANAPYYAIPPSNPDANRGMPFGAIWAKGLRNPWRFSFDRESGDLYIGDVGQEEVEEIDFQPASSTGDENYGWNVFEGATCFQGGCPNPSSFTQPIHTYGHSRDGGSVTGGFVYRGCALPDLRGTYFFGDWVDSSIRSFEQVGGNATDLQDWTSRLDPPGPESISQPSSFGEDGYGEIYILDYTFGQIFRIVPE